MTESKQEEAFKVVDRRLFTAEGELRKEVAEQQDRERESAASTQASRLAPSNPANTPAANPTSQNLTAQESTDASTLGKDTPKRSPAFENLIRSLGQNAAMLLGGYADPRTGQPMVDMDGAREIIDMLDVLREKTRGNLSPEEDSLMLDIAGNLKLAYMEMTKATAAAAVSKGKTRA